MIEIIEGIVYLTINDAPRSGGGIIWIFRDSIWRDRYRYDTAHKGCYWMVLK